jgi:hypothetical protein
MNAEQKNGIVREVIVACAALVSQFNIIGEQQSSDIAALLIGVTMLAWAHFSKDLVNMRMSFLRKSLQAVAPVLVGFNLVNADQGVAITAFALTIASILTIFEKKQPK